MDRALLTGRAATLLADERTLLGDIRDVLARAAASPETIGVLRRAAADLDQLFLLVVVGEFNAGKSAFVNVLLGDRILAEGVTPTTAAITVVSHGDAAASRTESDGVVLVTSPAAMLRDLSIVDTPGTNAILRQHERLTRDFVPRSDLVLFVTSADRPFTESERDFLETIRNWGKKVVVVLNKVDLLRSESEVDAQRAFITEGTTRLLGFAPELFPVSARLAGEALDEPDPARRAVAWADSGFEVFERFLRSTLDDGGRLRLKLLSPLGIADRVVADQRGAIAARLQILREDLLAGERIERQLALYQEDMARDLAPRIAELENAIREMGERGEQFFDDTLRLGRILDLFKAERIRADFERQVVADTPDRVDRLAQDLVDWMVDQDARLWRSVSEQVEQRHRDEPDGVDRRLSGSFDVDRRALLQSIGRAARDVIDRHDHRREAQELATSVRESVTRAMLVEAGAVSLGAVTMAVVGSAAADVTGLLAAGVLAGVGFYILPLKKRRARAQFRERTEELRVSLATAMRDEFGRQLEASLRRIRDALAPYDRFVRAERDRMEQHDADLSGIEERLRRARADIESLPTAGTGREADSTVAANDQSV
jgi:small GTP-binding protein